MAKTCRTCNEVVMQPRCPYQGRAFYHDREYCVDWSKRETPLLVDVLARSLTQCLQYVQLGDNQALYDARQALARYKEEVGDA